MEIYNFLKQIAVCKISHFLSVEVKASKENPCPIDEIRLPHSEREPVPGPHFLHWDELQVFQSVARFLPMFPNWTPDVAGLDVCQVLSKPEVDRARTQSTILGLEASWLTAAQNI